MEKLFLAEAMILQEALDELASALYDHWHDAIYNDAYDGDINKACAAARKEQAETTELIESCDGTLKDLYGEIKDGPHREEVKAVMRAYAAYYDLVMLGGQTFVTFSEQKPLLQQALRTAIHDLELEL